MADEIASEKSVYKRREKIEEVSEVVRVVGAAPNRPLQTIEYNRSGKIYLADPQYTYSFNRNNLRTVNVISTIN